MNGENRIHFGDLQSNSLVYHERRSDPIVHLMDLVSVPSGTSISEMVSWVGLESVVYSLLCIVYKQQVHVWLEASSLFS